VAAHHQALALEPATGFAPLRPAGGKIGKKEVGSKEQEISPPLNLDLTHLSHFSLFDL
jgi:hypothetical protein